MGRWSSTWRWVERVKAWDAHLDRTRRAATESEVAKMAKRHADQAADFQGALTQPVKELLARVDRDPGVLKELPLDDLLALVARSSSAYKSAVDVERLARGLETDRAALDVTDPAAGGGRALTVDDLRDVFKEVVTDERRKPPPPSS